MKTARSLAALKNAALFREKTRAIFAYIFVDVPNLISDKPIKVNRINWAAMIGYLAHHNGNHLLVRSARAYTFLPTQFDRKEEWDVYRRLTAAGFQVECRQEHKRDIDVWIVADMSDPDIVDTGLWEFPARLILVSGDKDYIRPIMGLKKRFEDAGTGFSLHVVSWRAALADGLEAVSDEVTYMEDLLPLVDFATYSRLQHADPGAGVTYDTTRMRS